jgi:pimeloyl-ACP methyl ester carboxylesterase
VQAQKLKTETGREELRYLQAGSGPPVLLVHGLLGGSFCWRFNTPQLSRQHTVLAVDLPGFGESDAPRNLDCGMEAQAERLAGFLEKLSINGADVIASSWGGAVAILLAARSPRVRSLVLAAPVNPWSTLGAGRVNFLSGRMGGALLRLAMPVSRPVHRLALERMYGDPSRIPPGTLEGYSALLLRRGRVHNVLNTLRSWENDLAALPRAIARVQAPCLLIWGTRDGAVDPRSSGPLMRALPGSELAMIEGAGHLPFEETPEEFNRLALAFLDGNTAAAR